MDTDTIANLVAVSYHLGREEEVIARYATQLRTKAPGHALIVALDGFDAAFERVAAAM